MYKWFSEQVNQLVFSFHKLDFNFTFLNMISYEMMSDFNMFSFRMLNWVFSLVDYTYIITKKNVRSLALHHNP